MKKKIRIIVLLVIAVLLTGCTSLSTERKDENEQDITGYEEILDLMKAEGWRDNSLDAYYADVRCEIKYEVPDGADSSIGGQFIVASRNNVFIIRKWLYEDYKKNWDEKYTVDINGDLSKNRISRQVFCVGASTCANGYICEYI